MQMLMLRFDALLRFVIALKKRKPREIFPGPLSQAN
jgi:hypothetical protein